jgi:hypothetical protein
VTPVPFPRETRKQRACGFLHVLVNDGERQATDFVAFLVRDQDREVTLPQVRPLVQYASRDRVGGIHCFNVIMQFSAALIHGRLGVHQVEMIERHLTLQHLSDIKTRRDGALRQISPQNSLRCTG